MCHRCKNAHRCNFCIYDRCICIYDRCKLSTDENLHLCIDAKRATTDAVKKQSNLARIPSFPIWTTCSSRYKKHLLKTRKEGIHAKLLFFVPTSMLPNFHRCKSNGNAARKAIFQHCVDSSDVYILLFLS